MYRKSMSRYKSTLSPIGGPNHLAFKKSTAIQDLFYVVIQITVVFVVLYVMNRNTFLNNPLVFGDLGPMNLNSSYLVILSGVSPWLRLYTLSFFRLLPSEFGLMSNTISLVPMLLMPVSMYFLLKKLGMKIPARVAGAIVYVVNPVVLVWGGFEYAAPLLFIPLMAIPVISYAEDGKFMHLLYSGIVIFIAISILGFTNIKFILPIYIFLLFVPIWKTHGKTRFQSFANIFVTAMFIFVLSIPLLLDTLGAFSLYSSALNSSGALLGSEKGIVEYVFQSSDLQNSIMALTIYPGSFPQIAGYAHSWSELAWFFIVMSGIFSALNYRGRNRGIYSSFLVFIGILIIFQYGVYNGTFIGLYRNPFVVIYNYPLFLDVMQIFIYSVFFSLFVELIQKKFNYAKITIRVHGVAKKVGVTKPLAILAVALIIMAALPIIEFSNGNGTLNANPNRFAMPSYWKGIITTLSPFQSEKTLVLPNNDTTLTYMDAAVPYSEVYGLPYNYQAFPTEFPNVTEFSKLGTYFADENVSGLSRTLVDQNIGIIVIVGLNSNASIVSGETTISGGGMKFARIINATNIYGVISETSSYLIYKYKGEPVTHGVPTVSSLNLYNGFVTYKNSKSSVYAVTGKYSHIAIPVNITSTSHLGISNGEIYQQRLFIPYNLSNEINSNFTNIYFASGNAVLLPAWIQSVNSSGAIIWVKLTFQTEQTIYIWIFPKYYDMLSRNGYLGESPLLSSQYGEFDNGASVFSFYQNFTSLSSVKSDFYIGTTLNYSVNNGLYLGEGTILTSYYKVGNGTLFGMINYETPNNFGSGGADVAHNIFLVNSYVSEGIFYNTYSQQMQLHVNSSSSTYNYFHFNTLYNYAMHVNGNKGSVVFCNTTLSSNINNNESYSIQLQNQATGTNGTMYLPYIAYLDTNTIPSYSFENASVQQGTYNNVIIGNPGDVNSTQRFIAYDLNSNGNISFEWDLNNKTFSGQVLNYSFSSAGTRQIAVMAKEKDNNITLTGKLSEHIIGPVPSVNISSVTEHFHNGTEAFKSTTVGGTDAYYYTWYVNGVHIGGNSPILVYSFLQSGRYEIELFIQDSGSGIATSNKIFVNISANNRIVQTGINVWMIIYNMLSLPFGIIFLVQAPLKRTLRKLRLIWR